MEKLSTQQILTLPFGSPVIVCWLQSSRSPCKTVIARDYVIFEDSNIIELLSNFIDTVKTGKCTVFPYEEAAENPESDIDTVYTYFVSFTSLGGVSNTVIDVNFKVESLHTLRTLELIIQDKFPGYKIAVTNISILKTSVDNVDMKGATNGNQA